MNVSTVQFGGGDGASTYHLNGGTLNVSGNIVNEAGESMLYIDGGTLNLTGAHQ